MSAFSSPKDPFKHRCYISQSFFGVCNSDSHASRCKIFRILLYPPHLPLSSHPFDITSLFSDCSSLLSEALLEAFSVESFAFKPEFPGGKLLCRPPPYFGLLSQTLKLFQWKGVVAAHIWPPLLADGWPCLSEILGAWYLGLAGWEEVFQRNAIHTYTQGFLFSLFL